jgi:hypothetical protein
MNRSKKGLQPPDSKPEPFERYHTNSEPLGHLARYPADAKPPGIMSLGGPAGSSRHHKHNVTGVFTRALHRDMSWQSCLGGHTSSKNRTQVTSSTPRRIHRGVEVTESSTNKHHTLSLHCSPPPPPREQLCNRYCSKKNNVSSPRLLSPGYVPSPGYTSAKTNVVEMATLGS